MKKNFFILFVIAFVALVYPQMDAEAANPKAVTLKMGETYSQYDVTGDKKADTIKIEANRRHYDGYKGLTVTVNDSVAYSISGKDDFFYGLNAKLYTLKNNKVFLYLYATENNGDGPVCGLFYYQKGKFIKNVDFQSFIGKYGMHNFGNVASVSGNTMKLSFYSMTWSIGSSEIVVPFKYKDGKMVQSAKTVAFKNTILTYQHKKNFTVKRKTIKTYKKVGSKKKSITLKRGNKVTIKTCYIYKGQLYLKIQKGKKSGWLKGLTKPATYNPKTNEYDVLFKEVQYAG